MELFTRLRRKLRDVNPTTLDALLATGMIVACLGGHFSSGDRTDLRDPDAFSILLTLAVAVPYYFRRRAPLLVFAISTVPVVVLSTRHYQVGATPNVLLVGFYTVAAYCDVRSRAIAAAIAAVGLAIVGIVGAPGLDSLSIAFNYVLFAVAYFVGANVRNRRLYTGQIEERAVLLERERDEEAHRAVAEERLRIAQDLHDVVAHSMGVIAVQAGVGAHVIDKDPAEAKKSLEAIAHTSRSALNEIRRMLGVLREDEGAEYVPAPGLADLERLLGDVRAAGLPVDVRYEGTRGELPPGIDFTAYRIVQEALTNVLKHAGPARATVVIGYEPAALSLAVSDDGRGVNGRASDGGHGLMGMRERVGVYGGSFDAGPATGGGFRVAVRLPYGEPA